MQANDHFNRGWFSVEAFFQPIKCTGNEKAFKMEKRKNIGWKKASIRKPAPIEEIISLFT